MQERVTAKQDTLLQDAVHLLNDRHVGSIIIVDEEQKCIGIFTERDAIRVFAQKFPPRPTVKQGNE